MTSQMTSFNIGFVSEVIMGSSEKNGTFFPPKNGKKTEKICLKKTEIGPIAAGGLGAL